jgi:hypothetical protein
VRWWHATKECRSGTTRFSDVGIAVKSSGADFETVASADPCRFKNGTSMVTTLLHAESVVVVNGRKEWRGWTGT